jgi:hypothetical protein
VTNSNLGGGLDLYASTWNVATGGIPPGETKCNVYLSSKNSMYEPGPVCYYASGEVNNNWYNNVGLLNTGAKIVNGAKINGKSGAHRGNNPYYAFDGHISKNSQVEFSFQDGSSTIVNLSECRNGANKQIWS